MDAEMQRGKRDRRQKRRGAPVSSGGRRRSSTTMGAAVRCSVAVAAGLTIGASQQTSAQGVTSGASPTPGAAQLAPVVVTATRTESDPFDVPASLERVEGSGIRNARLQVNISESLGGGARTARTRPAELRAGRADLGARLRRALDVRHARRAPLCGRHSGHACRTARGRSRTSISARSGRIEVLRGPFSALYGNSSGGVRAGVHRRRVDGAPQLVHRHLARRQRWAAFGSGLQHQRRRQRLRLRARARAGFTDRWLPRSQRRRARGWATCRLDLEAGRRAARLDADRPTAVSNCQAQDPLGLTRAQFECRPTRRPTRSALTFNTRKTVRPDAGWAWCYERACDDQVNHAAVAWSTAASAAPSSSRRSRSAPQANPLHPGGVIDWSATMRHRSALDVRTTLAGRRFEVVGGLCLRRACASSGAATRTSSAPPSACRARCAATSRTTVSNARPVPAGASGSSPTAGTLHAGVRHSHVRFRVR